MEITEEIEIDCPCWAASYLGNNDSSGLSDEDIKTIQTWMSTLKREGEVYDFVFTSDVDEFNPYPAFGTACATVKTRLIYFKK